jgi:hypothetical protein
MVILRKKKDVRCTVLEKFWILVQVRKRNCCHLWFDLRLGKVTLGLNMEKIGNTKSKKGWL